jgi:hypothetical protein
MCIRDRDTITFKNNYFHENVIQIENYTNETINFDLTTESKLKIINLGQIYASKFVKEYPGKICKEILDDIINSVTIGSNIKKFQDASTQTFNYNKIKEKQD